MRGPCDNIGREQPHADVLGLVQEHRIDRPIPGRLAIRVKAWASRENVAASIVAFPSAADIVPQRRWRDHNSLRRQPIEGMQTRVRKIFGHKHSLGKSASGR
jgi:hypothetical protein